MAKKKVQPAQVEVPEPEPAPKEITLEEVLGVLINMVGKQTEMIGELLERIPPKIKLS